MSIIVIVIVGMKIARSHVLGICAHCKYNQLVHIEVCTRFELLEKARLTRGKNHGFLFSMAVVYQPHPLYWHVLMRLGYVLYRVLVTHAHG